MEAQPWPRVCNFLCLAVTVLRYFEKVQWNFLLALNLLWQVYMYTDWDVLAIDCCLQNCDTSVYLWLVCVLNWWFFFLCPEVSIQIQGVHSNPRTNQLTEKKHSKRKALYRPLERTEPLKRKAGWETEAQSVKRSTLKKNEPSQVSMRTKNTTITNKRLGRRRPKRMPYEEPTGRDRSSKEC